MQNYWNLTLAITLLIYVEVLQCMNFYNELHREHWLKMCFMISFQKSGIYTLHIS